MQTLKKASLTCIYIYILYNIRSVFVKGWMRSNCWQSESIIHAIKLIALMNSGNRNSDNNNTVNVHLCTLLFVYMSQTRLFHRLYVSRTYVRNKSCAVHWMLNKAYYWKSSNKLNLQKIIPTTQVTKCKISWENLARI